MSRSEVDFGLPTAPLMLLGLGLLFLGRQDSADATMEILKTLPSQISKVAQALVSPRRKASMVVQALALAVVCRSPLSTCHSFLVVMAANDGNDAEF